MKTTIENITTLFLDIGGVLLTSGWDRKSRQLAITRFQLDGEETEERHHLIFHLYVDSVINQLKPLLSKDDLVIDCGNSHYTDTNLRIKRLAKEKIHFMGVGISGGEYGARNGPSIMPGGSKKAYNRVARYQNIMLPNLLYD